MMCVLARVLMLCVWCCVLLGSNTCATAQDDTTVTITPRDGQDGALDEKDQLDLSGLSLGAKQDVQIALEGGVGVGSAREGEWAGVRIVLTDTGTAVRSVVVRLSSPDSDGDLAEQQRVVSTAPGTPVGVWMYTMLPFASQDLVVRVYEEGPIAEGEGRPEERVRVGRLLGSATIRPAQLRGSVIPAGQSLIGVMGSRLYGLQDYGQEYLRTPFAEHGHEVTKTLLGLRPGDLPDRWMGLQQFEAIVWGAGDPLELQRSAARADALIRWVQRGGHLVVVLPSVGQAWTDAQNPLSNILPDIEVERRENADMLEFRPLLTTPLERNDPYPARGTVHVLRPRASAAPQAAMVILESAAGEPLVVRRLVGTGAVTVIGLDLNHPGLQNRVFADMFWHRVLGRRGDLRPPRDRTTAGAMGLLGGEARNVVDDAIPVAISVMGRSAVGAAVSFVLFVVYWLCVGPPLFYILRKKGAHHKSWLLFMAGTAVFGVLAWTGATLLRPRKPFAQTFVLLDHVYASEVSQGTPQQRARLWSSVLIPRYGDARLSVGSTTGDAPESLCSLAPFASRESSGSGRSMAFPDTRPYVIETTSPDAATMPARATVKSIVADWAGSPIWGMPLPTAATGDADPSARIRLVRPELLDASASQPGSDSGQRVPAGTLVHALPGALENITIVFVRRQSNVRGVPGDFEPTGSAVSLDGFSWKPGEPLSLESIYKQTSARNSSLRAMFDNFSNLAPTSSARELSREMLAMSFMHLFEPVDRSLGTNITTAQRYLTQGLDLSRWTTQPCLIIIGTVALEAGKTPPVPLYLDGEPLPMTGTAVVRWIYPLEADAPVVNATKDQLPRRSERERAQQPGDGATGEEGGP